MWRRSCSLILITAVYMMVIMVQLYMWPNCEEDSSYTLSDDIEDEELDLPSMPSNLLEPRMWSDKYHAGHCGTWQKQYTKLHRAILAGERPPAYLVYSTGSGFPPIIEGIPHAMKGIATVFMMAVLTERAFIIDWRAPAGFDNILSPRYTNWNPDAVLTNRLKVAHVHDIGSLLWFEKQNASVDWYMNTKFDDYFTEVVEVVQAHSYDFTYALLRNAHFRHKISRFGMHNMKCRVCCMWNYLFKFSSGFTRQMNSIARKRIGLSQTKELLFLNVPFQNKNLPRKFVLRQASNALKCAKKLTASLKQPSWVLASNSFVVLEELPKMYPQIKSQSIFYTQERYLIDLHRENSSHTHQMGIPKTEQNALLHYFVGFFLQLNSTVLFSYHHSPYSETMAAYRYFHYPSGRYMVYPDQSCQFQRYRY